eukprot:405384-Hanusia_phi.AAC.2
MKGFVSSYVSETIALSTEVQDISGVKLYSCSCKAGFYVLYGPLADVTSAYFSDVSALSESGYYCSFCPFGSNSTAGDFGCRTCAADKELDVSLSSCVACTPGYWCDWCDLGTYAASVSQTYCSLCLSGHYQPGRGLCSPCPAGTYQLAANQTSCTNCGEGLMSSTGSTCCLGYYLVSGQCVLCPGCPAGEYRLSCAGTNPGYCTPCSTSCPSGQYLEGCGGLSSGSCQACASCPTGSYRMSCGGREPGTCSYCDHCGEGFRASGCGGLSAGSCVACASCPAGQYRAGCVGVDEGECWPCTQCSIFKVNVGCGGVSPGACADYATCPADDGYVYKCTQVSGKTFQNKQRLEAKLMHQQVLLSKMSAFHYLCNYPPRTKQAVDPFGKSVLSLQVVCQKLGQVFV